MSLLNIRATNPVQEEPVQEEPNNRLLNIRATNPVQEEPNNRLLNIRATNPEEPVQETVSDGITYADPAFDPANDADNKDPYDDNIPGVVGNIASSITGSAMGSKVGTVLGTPLGPKGMIAGNALGGFAGGVAGDFGHRIASGQSIPEAAKESITGGIVGVVGNPAVKGAGKVIGKSAGAISSKLPISAQNRISDIKSGVYSRINKTKYGISNRIDKILPEKLTREGRENAYNNIMNKRAINNTISLSDNIDSRYTSGGLIHTDNMINSNDIPSNIRNIGSRVRNIVYGNDDFIKHPRIHNADLSRISQSANNYINKNMADNIAQESLNKAKQLTRGDIATIAAANTPLIAAGYMGTDEEGRLTTPGGHINISGLTGFGALGSHLKRVENELSYLDRVEQQDSNERQQIFNQLRRLYPDTPDDIIIDNINSMVDTRRRQITTPVIGEAYRDAVGEMVGGIARNRFISGAPARNVKSNIYAGLGAGAITAGQTAAEHGINNLLQYNKLSGVEKEQLNRLQETGNMPGTLPAMGSRIIDNMVRINPNSINDNHHDKNLVSQPLHSKVNLQVNAIIDNFDKHITPARAHDMKERTINALNMFRDRLSDREFEDALEKINNIERNLLERNRGI